MAEKYFTNNGKKKSGKGVSSIENLYQAVNHSIDQGLIKLKLPELIGSKGNPYRAYVYYHKVEFWIHPMANLGSSFCVQISHIKTAAVDDQRYLWFSTKTGELSKITKKSDGRDSIELSQQMRDAMASSDLNSYLQRWKPGKWEDGLETIAIIMEFEVKRRLPELIPPPHEYIKTFHSETITVDLVNDDSLNLKKFNGYCYIKTILAISLVPVHPVLGISTVHNPNKFDVFNVKFNQEYGINIAAGKTYQIENVVFPEFGIFPALLTTTIKVDCELRVNETIERGHCITLDVTYGYWETKRV